LSTVGVVVAGGVVTGVVVAGGVTAGDVPDEALAVSSPPPPPQAAIASARALVDANLKANVWAGFKRVSFANGWRARRRIGVSPATTAERFLRLGRMRPAPDSPAAGWIGRTPS
jgi:hypothetical protein